MKTRTRQSLLVVSLVALAGCLDVSFTVAKTVQLQVDAVQTTYTGVVVVDLSTNSDFQNHKSKVDGITLEKVLISVASTNTGNAATQLASGSLALRADGAPSDGTQDVQIGSIPSTSPPMGPLVFQTYLTSGGTKYSLPLAGAQAADKFLLDNVVKGSGKFSVVVTATTDLAPTHITLQLDLTNSLSYGLL